MAFEASRAAIPPLLLFFLSFLINILYQEKKKKKKWLAVFLFRFEGTFTLNLFAHMHTE